MARDETLLDEGATGRRNIKRKNEDGTPLTEQELYEASKQAGEELGVDEETLAYEAGMAGDSSKMNKYSPAARSAFAKGRSDKTKQTRETGGGTEPPYEAPEGTKWSFIGNEWKLYKLADDSPGPGPGPGPGPSSTASTADATAAAAQAAADRAREEEKQQQRKSAYDLLYAQFKQYGLESLVEPLKGLITSNTSPSEFIIKLRETDAYKKRFAGNAARVAKGLAAISEAEYIGLEDQYQNIMRNYGLPASYWEKDSMGTQAGFTNFIGNDVSATELEDRIMTAQKRVINSNPQVSQALKQFYPEITNGDILAYTLDPTQGLDVIKRKISAAEIGGAALAQGLNTGVTRAEELAKYGVNKEQAMQGYGAIGGGLQRGSQLASIYGQDPYSQTTAETEVFGLAGTQNAANQRKKLTGLEKATFSGQTGISSGALVRDRAGGY